MTWSISFLAWYFLEFFTITNYLPKFAVKYVGSRPITEIISSRRSFRPDYMVSGGEIKAWDDSCVG